MLKRCTNCLQEYVARWRNEPTTLCLTCRADVVLCAGCRAQLTTPHDANQLTLWPMLLHGAPRFLLQSEREPHFSHGRLATQAQKRKAPYH